MPSPPPRLAPTIVLAVLWVALYLFYLAVKPEPPAASNGRNGPTTTSVTNRSGDGEDVSRAGVPARAPVRVR